ncbi:hypothetical protein BKA70DRAFT_489881 [Coprinopsis sp. MPI-PUGE-AT-0042]|nr:hypothetical protein BKA70DRAFT_489881 [Coprinopsis sp. MPI-PUGE-AT-0042]
MIFRNSEVDLERKKLDAEIAVLEERIHKLKIKRNSLAPIYALPNELLCRMLLECREQWMQLDDKDCLGWIAFTHVCRAWRSAALEYPPLWSSVDRAMGVPWMETFLLRSKSAPLSLRISQEWDVEFMDEELEILSSILRDHQRLEGATIEMRGDEIQILLKEALENLTERMPNIVRFTLHNHTDDRLGLPSPLFANYAPRLQILSLDNFEPPWTSTIMEGLTSLSLLNTDPYYRIPLPLLKTFFEALSKMPGLQHLAIERILPDPDSSDPHISTLHFPSLHFLKLQGTCEQCSLVIRHIQIPISVKVKLRVFDVDESRLKELFEVLGFSWKGGPLSMESHTGEKQCDSISFSSAASFSISGSDGPLGFELDAARGIWTRSLHTILMNSIPVKHLTSLSFTLRPFSFFEPALLKMTLLQLLFVTKLFIVSSPGDIFKVLVEEIAAEELSGTSEQSTSAVYLPQLTSLRIAHIRFIRDSDSLRNQEYSLRPGDLEHWLRFRNVSGTSIQVLEIVDCSNMTATTVNTLQDCMGAGGRVVWDGIAREEFSGRGVF